VKPQALYSRLVDQRFFLLPILVLFQDISFTPET
jgi:hypothetical protein